MIDGAGRVVIRQGWVEPEPGVSSFPGALPAPDAESGPVREATFPGLGEVVYGTRRLKGGGFLAATVPADAAYRSLDESRNRLLSFGLAGLAVVLLVSLLVARGIVQPIRLLSEGARRMSAGDMDVTLPVRGQDELAELTRSFNEMSAQVRAGHETLEALAITDGLTGLYNRRHFEDVLVSEVRRAEREKAPLSLVMIDLDRFKQYNDRWGHREGDVELARVALRVKQAVRATDEAFRYGGEELAVLLPACPRPEAAAVAEKIRFAIDADAAHLGGRGTHRLARTLPPSRTTSARRESWSTPPTAPSTRRRPAAATGWRRPLTRETRRSRRVPNPPQGRGPRGEAGRPGPRWRCPGP